MPFVWLFQAIATLTLILFIFHYFYYIINALVDDIFQLNHRQPTFQQQQQQQKQQQQLVEQQQSKPQQNKKLINYHITNDELNRQVEPAAHTALNTQIHIANSTLNKIPNKNSATMQTDDAKFIKKRWKGGNIEPHPTDKALIVNYQLQATVFGEPDNPMIEEKKNCQKIIRLRSLNAKTDPAALAREVVEKCDLIHKSQLADVEQIIFYLKNRKDSGKSTTPVAMTKPNKSISEKNAFPTHRSASAARPHTTARMSTSSMAAANTSSVSTASGTGSNMPDVSINHIDEYVELLYEDLSERIRGSSMILQVARNPDNLEELEKNEACLSALSRVLREDWRKSLDLSTNIIYIFFCFSTYTKFHPIIVQYKIGSLCMDVIDYELRRYESMRHELDMRKNPDVPATHSAKVSSEKLSDSTDNFLDIMNEERPKEMEPPRRRIPELKQRPKSGNWSSFHGSMSSSLIKSQVLNNSYHEALSATGASTPDSGISTNGADMKATSNEDLDRNDPKVKKEEIDRLNKQLKMFAKKQEQLLRVAFYLLLNMAENVKLEEKMRRKNIVKMLVKALDRQNIDLLMLVTTFLKKLSIVMDNKDDMSDLNIIAKLPRLFQSGHNDLVQVTLKLVFNLSFDGHVRRKMITANYLPMMVMFFNDDKHHDVAVKILYHMSLDDKVKAMFTQTECVQMATDAIILNLNVKVDLDLIALCINLSLNKRNAQIMVEENRLHSLMDRAFKYQDSLLIKLLRNISQHVALRPLFIDYVGDLARILTISTDHSFIVDCVGILGNLLLDDLDYSQIMQNFELLPWIQDTLTVGIRPDDLVLDTIVYLGTCAHDELCALLLCRAKIMLQLIELLKAKQEDDEIVLQIIFVFQQILRHESTREHILRETEAPAYLIDLMHDKNDEIRRICDYCLDIMALSDSEWAKRIKLEKFRNHNSQWLFMVEQQDPTNGQDFPDNDDDNELNAYLRSEVDNFDLYNNGVGSGDGMQDSNKENDENECEHNENYAASPIMSNYNRPMSKYQHSQDLDESTFSFQKSNNAAIDSDAMHKDLLMI